MKLGREYEAIWALEKMLEVDPDNLETMRKLVWFYDRHGLLHRSCSLLTTLILSSSDDAERKQLIEKLNSNLGAFK
jgi:hypothetical protein